MQGPQGRNVGVNGRTLFSTPGVGRCPICSRPQTTMVPCWTQFAVAMNGFTRSSLASSVAPVWWSSLVKSRAGGQRKAAISSISWRQQSEARTPPLAGQSTPSMAAQVGAALGLQCFESFLPSRSWIVEEGWEWMASLRLPQR